MSPEEVTDVLADLDCAWWVAGGWALDLHLGKQTRAHADVDVLLLRDDLTKVRCHLSGWDLHAADPPGTLRPWSEPEVPSAQVQDIRCRRRPSAPWSLQLMIDDAPDGEWVYRRDARIHRPVRELDGPASDARRRVLAPEVQLLQKSANPRVKDEADFHAVRGCLDAAQRGWLRESLALLSPGHPWLAHL
jgi:hypothetical protein